MTNQTRPNNTVAGSHDSNLAWPVTVHFLPRSGESIRNRKSESLPIAWGQEVIHLNIVHSHDIVGRSTWAMSDHVGPCRAFYANPGNSAKSRVYAQFMHIVKWHCKMFISKVKNWIFSEPSISSIQKYYIHLHTGSCADSMESLWKDFANATGPGRLVDLLQSLQNFFSRRSVLRPHSPTFFHETSQDLVAFCRIRPWLFPRHEAVQDFGGILTQMIEGPLSRAQIEHDERKSIDVYLLIVVGSPYNFRRHVVVCPHTKSHGAHSAVGTQHVPRATRATRAMAILSISSSESHDFGSAEVCDLHVQRLRQKKIQWFQIAVDHWKLVKES